jgi:hypothetical protein
MMDDICLRITEDASGARGPMEWDALKFLRQIFQEGAALQWMDWRRGGLDRGKVIVGKTERHIGNSSGGLRPRWRQTHREFNRSA